MKWFPVKNAVAKAINSRIREVKNLDGMHMVSSLI
jgi:hypothetical protein